MIENNMDGELRLWLSLTRKVPAFRGAGRLCSLFSRFYARQARTEVQADMMGHRMWLDPQENIDRQLLFSPQLYEWRERRLLLSHLKKGDVFLDAGANIGFYTLLAAGTVGPTGSVLAVEAEPGNAQRLQRNIDLNKLSQVQVLNVGLSDKPETLNLGLNLSGNRGGHSFVKTGEAKVSIDCDTLYAVMKKAGVTRIDAAKFDIEGFEFKVLQRFFADAPASMVPRVILFEEHDKFREIAGGSTRILLESNHYRITHIRELNYLAVRQG